jgi:hypothetical protein
MAFPLRIFAVIASLALAAAVAVTECGGGSEEVSAEELVQKGDDVCGNVQERFAEIQAAPPASATQGELRDLEPPEKLRDRYDAYLDARESVSDELERGKQAAEDQDGEAYGKAQEEAVGGAPERRKLARKLGFRVCSQSAGAP